MSPKDIWSYINFGERLKKIRYKKGYSQREVAQMIGLPFSTYSNYENNNRTPKYEVLLKIANFFNVTIDDLLYGDIEERSIEKNVEDLQEYIRYLKKRPEVVRLLESSKNASTEDIERAIKIIEALKNDVNEN